MARSRDIKAPLARASYTKYLFTPRKDDKGFEYFETTLIFDAGTDLSEVKAIAFEAAKEAWGDKAEGLIASGMIKNPILDGDGKQARNKTTGELHPGMGPGKKFIRAKSGKDYPPYKVDRRLQPITSETVLYSGCYVFPVINAFTWENKEQGKGISFGIIGVQFVRDGDRLGGGGGKPEDHLAPIEDDGSPMPTSVQSGKGAAGLFD